MPTCAVTGGGSGIGRAVCLRVAGSGFAIAVLDRAGGSAERVAEEVRAAGGTALAYELDLRDEEAVRATLLETAATMQGLHALVTCAGVSGPVASVLENQRDDILELFAVNALGTMLAVKHAAPLMRKHGGGAIVCVASAAALVGSPGRSAYCASKGAIAAFAKTAAVELAGEGIRVNVVSPGIVDTPMVADVLADQERQGARPRHFDNLLDRMASADEVAAVIDFLLSEDASFMYGSDVVVDAGKVAR